jgi:hypothetical protein
MKAWHTVVCAGSMVVMVNSAVLAACEPFVAYLPVEGRQFEYKDINNDGKISAGDKLIGRDTIFDGDGNEIGRVFLLVDLHRVDSEGIATKWTDNQIFVFKNGGLFGFKEFDGPKLDVRELTPDRLKKQNLKATTQIIGGTGDYAGASGTLDFTIREGSATNHFNVTCN